MKQRSTTYGFKNWNTCQADNGMISVINSLRDKTSDGIFGSFDHVIMAQDWSCLHQSSLNGKK